MQWKITSNKHGLQRAKAVKLYIIKSPVSGKKHGLLCGRKLSNQNFFYKLGNNSLILLADYLGSVFQILFEESIF